jgi:hypothetical protein
MSRTVSRWVRFIIGDSASPPTLREIPINSINNVGLDFPEEDVSAFQDAVKGVLSGQPDCSITVTGPFDNSALAVSAGSGAAPTLSGSHTVLSGVVGTNHTLPLGVMIGMRAYWTEATMPAFVLNRTDTAGFICTAYDVHPEDGTYTATFRVYPGSPAPAWVTALPTSGA